MPHERVVMSNPPMHISKGGRYPISRDLRAMASTTTTSSATRGLTSPALADGKAPAARQEAPHCVGHPTLPPPPHVASPSLPRWAASHGRLPPTEIDRLPVVPGALELAGIGYTGWFAYRDLVFKPDREALIAKIKNICYDIIGRS
ncbi:uncharacterized protein [Elaeis guineensis]|uniref:uncharacterized protein isoform X2 n=1 Tax=Elaeis guineensis var. tenera TaxID=51953 RepID=UPI003C6D131A